MTRRLLILLIGLVGLVMAQPVGAAPRHATPNLVSAFSATSAYCADSEEAAFLKLINDYRAQNGLGAVALSQTLGAASDHHSIDMADKNYFSHTLLDGTSYSQNFINHGYTTTGGYTGENIAAGYTTASAAFTGWKNSAGHNANMLNPSFKAIGIGRAYNASSNYGWYWTTGFGGYADAAGVICSGSTTSPTPTPTATATTTKVYVSALAGSAATKRGAITISVSATIKDSKKAAVSNATITLKLVDPKGGAQTYTATSNSRGQATWSIKAASGAGTYTASVANIVSSGRVYDPGLNAASILAINAS